MRRVRLIHAPCALGVLLAIASCSGGSPPSRVTGAPKTAPDESYETDGAYAFRVLVWKCNARHERVVMHQRCAEGCTGCRAWEIDRTLCPAPGMGDRDAVRTAFERTLTEPHERARNPIPEGWGWR